MNKWYVSLDSKARGPYTDLEVREKIKSGDLKADSLTYKEGDADWKKLEDQEIWSPLNQPAPSDLQTKSTRDWVLLVENPIKAGDYAQQGPFTEEEVRAKVEIGEVHLKDYCWKKGMADWKPLVDLPELVYTRKDKVSFKEESFKVVSSEQLIPQVREPKVLSETELFEQAQNLPDFIEPNTQLSQKPFKRASRVSKLASVKDYYKYKKEVKVFLLSVFLVFALGLTLGKFQHQALVSGLKSLQSSLKGFTKLLSKEPVLSYLLLRGSLSDKKMVLLRTDAPEGSLATVKAFDLKGKEVPLQKGLSSPLKVLVDRFGVAEIETSKFQMNSFRRYKLTAEIGHIRAEINYTYVDKE